MIAVEDMRAADEAALLALNNFAVPEVNDLTAAEFAALVALSRTRVARRNGQPVGFVMTFGPAETYDSTNYQWFQGRFDAFYYVDRIVVGEHARGLGAGRALYEDVIAHARAGGFPRVCSEVNTVPPNPGSMAFHAALGFVPLLERVNPQSGKTVAMMTCELGAR